VDFLQVVGVLILLAVALAAVVHYVLHKSLGAKIDAGILRLETLAHIHHASTDAKIAALPPTVIGQAPVTILSPVKAEDAFKRYRDAGGMAAAVRDGPSGNFSGGLNWYEICWLKSLTALVRHQWAVDFAAGAKADPASLNIVSGIGMDRETASYLLTLAQNYNISWDAP
jgi:hypothetical protein